MYTDTGGRDSTEAHCLRASLGQPSSTCVPVAHCHLGFGKLYRRRGRRQEAQEYLATATTMYREMDMSFWLEQAEAELATLTQERRDGR